MKKSKLACAITMGDPAGIGPEVTLKALKQKSIQRLANFLIIGNAYALERTAQACKINFKMGDVALLNVGKIPKLVFGRPALANGSLALECIQKALDLIKSKRVDALITAPVNKHTINQALLREAKKGGARCCFRGHTEYLAKAAKTKDFAMMLVGGAFKVILVTTHMALEDVPHALTQKKTYQTLRLAAFALRKYFGISHPRIGVCGLNPHSGEEGTFGHQERKVIRPAVNKAKRFASIEGPLAADTLFYLARQGEFDAVVAMYHDQGLIPLKMLSLHQGVNLTLGLPFVRTSPDHGTAYNIAGKNKANPGSMIEAIKLAVKIGQRIKL